MSIPWVSARNRKDKTEQLEGISRESGQWKKFNPKHYIVYDSIYIIFMNYQNLKIGEKIIGCQGVND